MSAELAVELDRLQATLIRAQKDNLLALEQELLSRGFSPDDILELFWRIEALWVFS